MFCQLLVRKPRSPTSSAGENFALQFATFFSGTVVVSQPFLTVLFPTKPSILYLSNAGIAGSSASGCIYVYMYFLCFVVQGKIRIATARSPCKYN